jgi:phosphoserine aminotransferase
VVATSESSNFNHSPPQSEWKLDSNADYFHVCSNETVHGHRLPTWPKHPNLIVDASSEFMSRPHPVKDCAMVYGGAQKNLGPSGVVLCIIRKDMYPKQKKALSKLWSFKDQAENKSMINTPPTFGVYILLEIFRWLDAQGGLAAMEKRNATKAKLIYDAIDSSNGFYKGTVANKDQRSHMNVTYTLPGEEITDEFVKTATKSGMMGLKGYRTVGGIRASIYNAMPVEGCQSLANFMKDFASKKS